MQHSRTKHTSGDGPAPRDLRPPSVLLVTGEPAACSRIREQLCDHGFDVCSHTDGRAALALLERRSVDVVIADVLLPETNIAVPHVLRRQENTRCPILIGLADEGAPCVVLRDALGFDLVVQRDSTATELIAHVRALLAQRVPAPRTAGPAPAARAHAPTDTPPQPGQLAG